MRRMSQVKVLGCLAALFAAASFGAGSDSVNSKRRLGQKPPSRIRPQRLLSSDQTPPRIDRMTPPPGTWVVSNAGLSSVQFGFDEPVAIPAGSISAWTIEDGEVSSFAGVYNAQTRTVDVTFDPPIRDDILTLILDYVITDLAGNELDGEISNAFNAGLPSGNGTRGGQAVFRFNVLQGDVTHNGEVDSTDGAIIRAALGHCTGDAAFNPYADVNADGCVTVLDVATYSLAEGRSLPPADGTVPTITQISPDPGFGLGGDVATVSLAFDEAINPASFHPRSCFLLGSVGELFIPTSATLAPNGLSATYDFSPAPAQCGEYAVNITNTFADSSGSLLSPPADVSLSGFIPTRPPSLDAHSFLTNQTPISITGSAPGVLSVEVYGPAGAFSFPVTSGAFTAQLPLLLNRVNPLYFTTISSCSGVRSAPAATAITHDSQAPNLFIDFPPDGAELTTAVTDVAGRVGDMLSGFMGLTLTVNGIPAIVEVGTGNNGTFVARDVPLTVGTATPIEAIATDSLGNVRTRQISVTRIDIPDGSPSMAAITVGPLSAPIYTKFAQPLEVEVLRSNGSPFVGKVVNFEVTRSDGRLSPTANGAGTLMAQAITDANGIARVWWKLGGDSGSGNNRVEVTSKDIAGTVFFSASATPGPARQINIGDGNNQRAAINSPAPLAIRAKVSDGCNGVEGQQVTFTVTGGGGKVVDLVTGQTGPSLSVTTSNTGHAGVRFTLGPESGNQTVEADFPGNPGETATFNFYAVVGDQSQPTIFRGLVLDNASQPIGGASCMLVINGQFLPSVTTNVDGQFEITSIAGDGPGRLYVNGMMATSVGGIAIPFGTYPAMQYDDFSVVKNAVNSLPTPVVLPRLNPANARSYSTIAETVLTVQGMEGLRMVVTPGSMKLPNGMPAPHGTVMSLNQVHHDDVPMPMPDGAAPPFAWTLQPAGASFDPPVRVEYPNMSGLPAGAVAYFLTWNPNTGRFEIFCTGTVSDDGGLITTDPGSGLTLAGWGCNCPPYSVTGCCGKCNGQCKERRGCGCVLTGFPCGAECCTAGQVCCDGSCQPVGTYPCGDTCCQLPDVCCNGTCLPIGSFACGDNCCSPGQACCNGTCVSGRSISCGNTCCVAGEVCCNNTCQPSGSVCCPGGGVCDTNSCEVCDGIGSCRVTCDPSCNEACFSGTCIGDCERSQCEVCDEGACVVSCDQRCNEVCESGNCMGDCDRTECEICVGLGVCESFCNPALCEECEGGTCVSICDTNSCEVCNGLGLCEVTCDPTCNEVCDGVGNCEGNCDRDSCQVCDAGNCVESCDPNLCKACDGAGNCEELCDPNACQICDGAGSCVESCDPAVCETCDGAGFCTPCDRVCCDEICSQPECTVSVEPSIHVGCPGETLGFTLPASCSPDCERVRFELNDLSTGLTVDLPAEQTCDTSPMSLPFNVSISSGAGFSVAEFSIIEAASEASCGASAQVHVAEADIVFPYGDPGTNPLPGVNEFTYTGATPGVLTIPVTIRIQPDTVEVRNAFAGKVRIRISAIGDSHSNPGGGTVGLTWNNAFPGEPTAGNAVYDAGSQLWLATATFTGMPLNNADFGRKTTTVAVVRGTTYACFDDTDVEVFFPRDGFNHPGPSITAPGTPLSRNWFYYWNQTGAGNSNARYDDIFSVGEMAYGVTPAMLYWPAFSKTEVWIGPTAASEDIRLDGSAQRVTGIDLFCNTVLHEVQHTVQIAQNDAALGALNGATGTIWVSGWSFNVPFASSNHWTVGADGQPGVAGVDDDGDGATDERNDRSEVGFPGSDDLLLDVDNNAVWDLLGYNGLGVNAIEMDAGNAETSPEDTFWMVDWGNPGKQHFTRNYLD